MITDGDDNMADVSKDCDQPEDDEPILDFELDEYDRLLLENPISRKSCWQRKAQSPKNNLSIT